MAGGDLGGGGAHAAGEVALGIGRQRLVVGGDQVPGRQRLPSRDAHHLREGGHGQRLLHGVHHPCPDRIDVSGDATLATDVNASEFYLWSSTRAGLDWSISPAGLSSNGYNGHIFWDAETWMFPSLLAQHPELAEGMDNYRFDRLAQAKIHAQRTGWAGARFPWESALDGTEQIPPPASINSEGLYEQHIVADVALAQWQYYLASGDKEWLSERGWPVISASTL